MHTEPLCAASSSAGATPFAVSRRAAWACRCRSFFAKAPTLRHVQFRNLIWRAPSALASNAASRSSTSVPDKSPPTVSHNSHLEQALQAAIERRVLLIAAAGNDGCACIHLPAAVESVLSVGALGRTSRPLETSNWAEPYRRNGLLAPGRACPSLRVTAASRPAAAPVTRRPSYRALPRCCFGCSVRKGIVSMRSISAKFCWKAPPPAHLKAKAPAIAISPARSMPPRRSPDCGAAGRPGTRSRHSDPPD